MSVKSNPWWLCFCFTLLCDWSRKLTQSDAKQKPITTWSPAFSRALGSLLGFIMSSHWLTDSLLINFSVGFFLSSDWSLLLLCIWFHSTQSKRTEKRSSWNQWKQNVQYMVPQGFSGFRYRIQGNSMPVCGYS